MQRLEVSCAVRHI